MAEKFKKIFEKKNIVQFLKFAVVGVINTLIDWVVFFALTHFVMYFQDVSHEVIAKIISFIAAVVNSFIFNSLWTFKQEFKSGLASGEKGVVGTIYFGRFFIVSVIGLILNSAVFYLARPALGEIFSQVSIAQLGSLAIATFVVLSWNFLANKFWTYRVGAVSAQEIKKNRLVYIMVAVILGAMFCLSYFTMKGDSGIVDEIAHVPAGYTYLDGRDMRLNPEHPPLAKALAAMPLLFLNLHKPYTDWSWNGIDQWESGWYFLYEAGNSPDQMLFWSRLPILLLTLLTGLILFKWANKKFGAKTGLFVLFLFAFCPNILAHSHWVTTDIAATFAFLSSIYFYDQYMQKRDRKNLIIAGLIFGIAQLLKFSAFLLVPMMGTYLIILAIMKRKEIKFWRFLLREIWALVQIFLIGYVLVWLVYIVLYWNTPLLIEEKLINVSLPTAGQAMFNHFLQILAKIPFVSAFGHYLFGFLMVFSHTEGGHTAFLLGQFSRLGFKSYFPLAFLFKVPLPILILLFASFVSVIMAVIFKKFKNKDDIWNVVLFLVAPIIYFAVSIQGKLNIGIRHLLPTMPFFFMLIGWFTYPIIQARLNLKKVILIGLSVWLLVETLVTFPHYMAYFNELRLAMGLKKHEVLVDSNLDWGQDLKRLGEYCEENGITRIKVDYFGGGVPSYYIPGAIEWHSKYGKTKGWLAISATFYQMSKFFGPQEGLPDYSYLDNVKPEAVIGDSILVYYLDN